MNPIFLNKTKQLQSLEVAVQPHMLDKCSS